MSRKKILYWAYCANMLTNRMECCVHKSAKRLYPARVNNHKLVFGHFSKLWYGTLPTIVKDPVFWVWGSVWEIDECHKKYLDELQGVDSGIYKPITVPLVGPKGTIPALSYELVEKPEPPEKICGLPLKKYRPSKIYKEQMLDGAREGCLPAYYRKWLMTKFPDNGYTGSVLPRFDDEDND